ncbi:MAG: MFS transporter [Burkholderiales bacterium]|nr:MAG: MFS transporter [Burkholderiales bacterium]
MAMQVSEPLPPSTKRQDALVIALVGLGHGMSHYFHLIIAPLTPWLRTEFGWSYAQIGVAISAFYVASAITQALAGIWVDKHGPFPVIMVGMSLFVLAALGLAAINSYEMALAFSALAGVGNGVFHPADYTLLNRKVQTSRLGHAYSVHSISGNLGAAIAPLVLVLIASMSGWRVAYWATAALTLAVMLLMWQYRSKLQTPPIAPAINAASHPNAPAPAHFLANRMIWMCFLFFVFYATAQGTLTSFGAESARSLHDLPLALAGICLTVYLLCSAASSVAGGFLVANPQRCERMIALGFSSAAVIALAVAFVPMPPVLVVMAFGLIGCGVGVALPARDLLVKQVAPVNASGKVYGVVYSGIDVGMASGPAIFGVFLDHGQPVAIWLGVAVFQVLLITTALNVRRNRRAPIAPAT